MHAAAQKVNKVCVRGLMKMLSRRHPGYDGVSSQQEAFDFLDKVFQLLEEEDAAAVAASKQASYVVKDLFGGQKYTKVCFARASLSISSSCLFMTTILEHAICERKTHHA